MFGSYWIQSTCKDHKPPSAHYLSRLYNNRYLYVLFFWNGFVHTCYFLILVQHPSTVMQASTVVQFGTRNRNGCHDCGTESVPIPGPVWGQGLHLPTPIAGYIHTQSCLACLRWRRNKGTRTCTYATPSPVMEDCELYQSWGGGHRPNEVDHCYY